MRSWWLAELVVAPKVAARPVRSMPARWSVTLSLVPLKGDSADSVSGESKVVGGFSSVKLFAPNCW